MYKSIETVLSGQFAFFKNPDVNTKERFFTFACIHKVALNGILGAIIGLNGYKEMEEGEIIPEFQRKLENLKVSITPLNQYAYISKHMSHFNNTTGFASGEDGGVLVVHEQWLENPKWKIRIITDKRYYKDNDIEIDSEVLGLMEDSLLNSKCVFNPYLGSNSHPASFTDTCIKEIEEVKFNKDDELRCLSLVYEDDFDTIGIDITAKNDDTQYYKYRENLPIGLDDKFCMYQYAYLMATNRKLVVKKDGTKLFKTDDEIISFI